MRDWIEVVAGYLSLPDPDDVERLRRGVDGIRDAKDRERRNLTASAGRATVMHRPRGALPIT